MDPKRYWQGTLSSPSPPPPPPNVTNIGDMVSKTRDTVQNSGDYINAAPIPPPAGFRQYKVSGQPTNSPACGSSGGSGNNGTSRSRRYIPSSAYTTSSSSSSQSSSSASGGSGNCGDHGSGTGSGPTPSPASSDYQQSPRLFFGSDYIPRDRWRDCIGTDYVSRDRWQNDGYYSPSHSATPRKNSLESQKILDHRLGDIPISENDQFTSDQLIIDNDDVIDDRDLSPPPPTNVIVPASGYKESTNHHQRSGGKLSSNHGLPKQNVNNIFCRTNGNCNINNNNSDGSSKLLGNSVSNIYRYNDVENECGSNNSGNGTDGNGSRNQQNSSSGLRITNSTKYNDRLNVPDSRPSSSLSNQFGTTLSTYAANDTDSSIAASTILQQRSTNQYNIPTMPITNYSTPTSIAGYGPDIHGPSPISRTTTDYPSDISTDDINQSPIHCIQANQHSSGTYRQNTRTSTHAAPITIQRSASSLSNLYGSTMQANYIYDSPPAPNSSPLLHHHTRLYNNLATNNNYSTSNRLNQQSNCNQQNQIRAQKYATATYSNIGCTTPQTAPLSLRPINQYSPQQLTTEYASGAPLSLSPKHRISGTDQYVNSGGLQTNYSNSVTTTSAILTGHMQSSGGLNTNQFIATLPTNYSFRSLGSASPKHIQHQRQSVNRLTIDQYSGVGDYSNNSNASTSSPLHHRLTNNSPKYSSNFSNLNAPGGPPLSIHVPAQTANIQNQYIPVSHTVTDYSNSTSSNASIGKQLSPYSNIGVTNSTVVNSNLTKLPPNLSNQYAAILLTSYNTSSGPPISAGPSLTIQKTRNINQSPNDYGTQPVPIGDQTGIMQQSGPTTALNSSIVLPQKNYPQPTNNAEQSGNSDPVAKNILPGNVAAVNSYGGAVATLPKTNYSTNGAVSSSMPRPLQNVIPTCVYLMSRIAVHMEIEGTAQCPAQVVLAATLGCDDLGIANKLLAQSVFGLWMTSTLLEIQLKAHNRPYIVRVDWSRLLNRFSNANAIQKRYDEPMVALRRNVFFGKRDEEKIKDPRIIELLYEEARHNVLAGRYIMEPAHSIMLGGIQARIELGPYNVHSHTVGFFRESQSRFLPCHVAKSSSWLWLPISRKTSAEVRLLEQFKRVPRTATTRKLMRKYLEFCWALPFYGAAFFHGQIEQPIRGLIAVFSQKDVSVLIGINEKGIFLIDHTESTLLLGLRYEEVSWDFAMPSANDDPECLPCIFIQFDAVENGIAVTKLMQIFSRQAPMMDALISHFAEQMRHKRDGTYGEPSDTNNREEVNPIQNNGIGVLSNKLSRLTLATFDDEGRCIGQMGSLSISY